MKIDTISYLIRKNKGNYEHDEAMATAKVEEGELPANAFRQLKALVQHSLETDIAVLTNEERPTIPTTSQEEDAQPEAAPKAEEAPKRERRERKPRETAAPAKEEASSKDVIVYNPSIKKHKDLFAEGLDDANSALHVPGWDSDELLPKVKAAADKMANKPFLDAKTGKILDTFVESFKALLGENEKPKKKAL